MKRLLWRASNVAGRKRPPPRCRPGKSGVPRGEYRRLMKQRLDKHYLRYGQRRQIEPVNSMIKRRLGSVVAGRTYWSQCRDLMLLALTHNCMIVAEAEADEAAEGAEATATAPTRPAKVARTRNARG